MASTDTLRQWVVTGRYPKIVAEDFRTRVGIPADRYKEDARSGTGPVRLHGAAAFSFDARKKPEQCHLFAGTAEQRGEFEKLEKRAAKAGRPVCLAPCPHTWCPMHPRQLHQLKTKGWVPLVLVRTHSARKVLPTKLAIIDEVPNAIRVVGLCVEHQKGSYIVEHLDVALLLLDAAGLPAQAQDLRKVRNALVDALGHVEQYECDVYQVRPLPKLPWDADAFAFIVKEIKTRKRDEVLAAVRQELAITDNLDLKVDAVFDALRHLFSGGDALWSYSPNGKTLSIYMPVNLWNERLFGEWLTAIFDGTASGHYMYAGLPDDAAVENHRWDRPMYPNLVFHFGAKTLNKGSGTSKVPEKARYVVECMDVLRASGHDGDVLVVTHVDAEAEIKKALNAIPEVASKFEIVQADPAERGERRLLYLHHFGGLKGSNDMRSATAVIITHRHNLPHFEAVARAMAVFGVVHLLHDDGTGKLVEAPLARQWTPWRRGKTGKNKHEKALVSQQCDVVHSREVGYVMASHLAMEIVQALMRCILRDGHAAKVIVFVPLGEDTVTMAALLREFPGASVAAQFSDRVPRSEEPAVAGPRQPHSVDHAPPVADSPSTPTEPPSIHADLAEQLLNVLRVGPLVVPLWRALAGALKCGLRELASVVRWALRTRRMVRSRYEGLHLLALGDDAGKAPKLCILRDGICDASGHRLTPGHSDSVAAGHSRNMIGPWARTIAQMQTKTRNAWLRATSPLLREWSKDGQAIPEALPGVFKPEASTEDDRLMQILLMNMNWDPVSAAPGVEFYARAEFAWRYASVMMKNMPHSPTAPDKLIVSREYYDVYGAPRFSARLQGRVRTTAESQSRLGEQIGRAIFDEMVQSGWFGMSTLTTGRTMRGRQADRTPVL